MSETKYRNPLYRSDLRNKKCICMSGKKIKKCHGQNLALTAQELNEVTRLIDRHNKDYEASLKDQWDNANSNTHTAE